MSGWARTWEVSGAMPPTTIVDDEVPEPPAAVAVADDDELLQAVAVSAAAPMATANWIVRMRLLDKVFPFAGLLCSVSAPDTRSGPRDVTARGRRVARCCASAARGVRRTQVGVDHVGVVHDLVCYSAGEYLPALQDCDPVADRHHHVDLVLHQQHPEAPVVGEADDDARQLRGFVVVEPRGRLVEQDHRRRRRHGAGDGDDLALPEGDLPRLLLDAVDQLEVAQRFHRRAG